MLTSMDTRTREELEDRLADAESRLYSEDSWKRRKGNPYPYCAYCGRTNVEVSVHGGHRDNCGLTDLTAEIQELRRLLE